MAAILAEGILTAFSWIETIKIQIQISLKLVSKNIIGSKPTLVKVMALCRASAKPLPEPIMTQFNDAYTALGGHERFG